MSQPLSSSTFQPSGAFRDVYRGKRVLVTGHTGFKGSWLSEWLLQLGAEVTGFALPPPTSPALFDQLGLAQRLRHVVGDVRDLNAVQVLRWNGTESASATRSKDATHRRWSERLW